MEFKKDWEARAKEIEKKYISIPDGKYQAEIVSANFTKNDKGYEVVEIQVEILNNENLIGARSTKIYYVDNKYPHKKKLDYDLKQLDKLLIDFNLKYNSEEEFILSLYKLKNKKVSFELKTAEATNADGKNYKSRYINALNGTDFVNNEKINQKENEDADWNIDNLI